jgi:integrase/recombinase XerD
MASIETTVAAFGASMRRERRAPNGIERYMSNLRHLTAWGGGREVRDITKADLSAFEAYWWDQFETTHGREPADATVNIMQVSLIQFFRYLEMEELIDRNPARLIKPVKRTQRVNDWLRPEEDAALLRGAKSLRERFTIYLLRHTGMRVSEATGVLNRDVDVREWSLTIRKSKTQSGVRTIPILPELRPVLLEWRQYQLTRGLHQDHVPLLATRSGRSMHKLQMLETVKRACVRANVRTYPAPMGTTTARKRYRSENTSAVSCHTLRRTFGSDLINRGVRLEVVSKLLGHASTMVTERAYAELLEATIAREVLELVR